MKANTTTVSRHPEGISCRRACALAALLLIGMCRCESRPAGRADPAPLHQPALRRIPAQGYADELAVPDGSQLQILHDDNPVFHWTAGPTREFTALDWYRGPGTYTAIILPPTSMRLRIGQADFQITGDETRVILAADQLGDKPRYLTGAQTLPTPRILRVLDGSAFLALTRDWVPSLAGVPRYRIKNITDVPLYGRGADNTFLGRIEKSDGQHFSTFFRGYCGGPYASRGYPLLPGAQSTSKEPYRFSAYTKKTKLLPGRYRYVVRVSKKPPTVGVNEPLLEVHDEFVVQ